MRPSGSTGVVQDICQCPSSAWAPLFWVALIIALAAAAAAVYLWLQRSKTPTAPSGPFQGVSDPAAANALRQLVDLQRTGALTPEEYERGRQRVLNGRQS